MPIGRVRSLGILRTGDPALDRVQDHVKQQIDPVLQNPILSAVDFRWIEIQGSDPTKTPTFALQYRSATTQGGVPAWATLVTFDAIGRIKGVTDPTAAQDVATKNYVSTTLATQPTSAAYNSTTLQTIASGGAAVFNFETKEYDTDNAVTTGAAWKFTVPTGKPGIYLVSAVIGMSASAAAGEMIVSLEKNGSEVNRFGRDTLVGTVAQISGACDVLCVAGDFLQVIWFQNSGGNMNNDNTAKSCRITIRRVAGGV